MSKEKTTSLVVSTDLRDQAKIAAAMKRIPLQEFVEKTLRAEIGKTIKGAK